MTLVSDPGSVGLVAPLVIRPILGGLRALRADVAAILARAELDPACFEDPQARLRWSDAVRLWDAAVDVTGDAELGLHLAERADLDEFDLLGQILRASPSPLAAFDRFQRYVRLAADGVGLALERLPDRFVVEHRGAGGVAIPRASAEYVLGLAVVLGRQLLGRELRPALVEFRHPEPRDTRVHARLFCAPVVFGAPRNALAIPGSLAGGALPGANASLLQVLERYATRLVDELPPEGDFVGRVRHLLETQLVGGDPTAAAAAARLHMSVRTLRRRLAERGTTHTRLLAEVRREVAERLLARPELDLGEITWRLGFSEPSAFHRAFRRWTGTTPGERRRELSRGA